LTPGAVCVLARTWVVPAMRATSASLVVIEQHVRLDACVSVGASMATSFEIAALGAVQMLGIRYGRDDILELSGAGSVTWKHLLT